MKVLINGCGYLGCYLGNILSQAGHEVFGVRRNQEMERQIRKLGISLLVADCTRPETFHCFPKEIDWVVNCVSTGGGGEDDYRRTYVEGNRNLIRYFKSAGIKQYLYTSSTSVYGQNAGEIVTEESLTQPEAQTAKILLEAEQQIFENSDIIKTIVLRVAGIYGSGRGYAFKKYLQDGGRICGGGQRVMNMIHRDDLARIIAVLLEYQQVDGIYNVADNEPVTTLDFYKWVAKMLNHPEPIIEQTENKEMDRKRGLTNKRVSNRKLREEINYKFKFPTFREGYMEEISQEREKQKL